jgi:hypothetical protein
MLFVEKLAVGDLIVTLESFVSGTLAQSFSMQSLEILIRGRLQ